jgi:UDP-N-acetylmuramoylalanine--D-glutamate ligase
LGKAVVVGLARSGVGAANLLRAMGRDVTVTDLRAEAELAPQASRLAPGVGRALGGHPEGLFAEAELIVVSPGVPLDIEPLRRAREAGKKIIGELELAWGLLEGIPVYAVTGTNGKSTTVTLLDLMLRKAGKRTLLAGNIGNALSEEILRRVNGTMKVRGVDCAVVEASSFQLEAVERFRPSGAAILNITPDHMDRYASMDEYRAAKAAIAANQTEEDFLVLNAEDPECAKVHEAVKKSGKPASWTFSSRRRVEGVCLEGGDVLYDLGPAGKGKLVAAGDIRIKGIPNLENAMAASAMALLASCPPGAVREALMEFPGLEHRMEFVRELDGVAYVNDSKGTNVGAVARSLEGFASPVVLIAGGRDKGGDFAQLEGQVKEKVKAIILIGEAGEKIGSALCGLARCWTEDSLESAVRRAREVARAGETVLLSPGCASFDMFEDFEDRGRKFKELVGRL